MSKTITLLVGDNESQYVVHKSLLHSSPVLAKMCDGDFRESSEGIIKLPHDEPDVISCIVDYLYRGDFNFAIDTEEKSVEVLQHESWSIPIRNVTEDMDAFDTNPIAAGVPNDTDGGVKQAAAEYLAKVYIVAEKYQLKEMQPLILKKIASCIDIETNPEGFFNLSAIIYDGTPDSDETFRPYFREYCVAAIQEIFKKEEGMEFLDAQVGEGGAIAVDIFRAWRRLWRLQHELGRDQGRAPWFSQTNPNDCCQVATGQWEYWMNMSETLRYEHAVRHPRCSADHVENQRKFAAMFDTPLDQSDKRSGARDYLNIGRGELDRFRHIKESRANAVATQEQPTWAKWIKSLLGY